MEVIGPHSALLTPTALWRHFAVAISTFPRHVTGSAASCLPKKHKDNNRGVYCHVGLGREGQRATSWLSVTGSLWAVLWEHVENVLQKGAETFVNFYSELLYCVRMGEWNLQWLFERQVRLQAVREKMSHKNAGAPVLAPSRFWKQALHLPLPPLLCAHRCWIIRCLCT